MGSKRLAFLVFPLVALVLVYLASVHELRPGLILYGQQDAWKKSTPSATGEAAPATSSLPSMALPSTTPDPATEGEHRPMPSYPPGYLVPGVDEWCESWYSSKYLDYTASHHIEYCESDSPSRLECFRTHEKDPLCVARGVLIDRSRVDQGQNDTAMDCRLRNFTSESSASPALAAELKDILDITDMKEYFYDTGVRTQLRNWDMGALVHGAASCNAETNDKKWTLLARREGNNNIWHKLMELWQALLSLDILQIAIDPETEKPYLSAEDIPNVQVVIEDDEDSVVDSWWTMLTGKVPLRKSKMEASCLGNVILPLAGSSSPFWQGHWEAHDCHDTFLLDTCTQRLYRHLGLEPAPPKTKDTATTVSLIQRQGKTRRIFNLENYVERLEKRWPQVDFRTVHLEKTPLKDQVELFRSTDVLVGAMGAGLTAMLWLERESSVVEFMAPDADYFGFRNLAKWKFLHYFTDHGVDIAALNQTHEDWVARAGHSGGEQRDKHPDEETSELEIDLDTRNLEKRHWQNDEWLYIEEDTFITAVDAAIYAQLNKGLAKVDVAPV